jgi:hypothetical protein
MRTLLFTVLFAALGCGGSKPVGDPCASDGECGAGECAFEDPGGQCTGPCKIDADCGSKNVCAPENNEMECKRGCTRDADCRSGYECVGGVAPRLFCEPKEEHAMDMGTDALTGG